MLKNINIIQGVFKITFVSVFLSVLITFIAIIITEGNSAKLIDILKLALSIAVIVPLLVATPVAYYILQQRDELEVMSNKMAFLLRYDELTSLLTRRAFFQDVDRTLKKEKWENKPHAVFFIDLDHFKQVNDKFGHVTGDNVLRLFGKLMIDFMQENEIAGRLGGEEFCLFAVDCTPEKAFERAQKLVDEFRYKAQIVNNDFVSCTLSIGVAVSMQYKCLDEFINEADNLLYIAKEKGRNCVVMNHGSATKIRPACIAS